jgi:hypothetical protein
MKQARAGHIIRLSFSFGPQQQSPSKEEKEEAIKRPLQTSNPRHVVPII